MMNVELNKLIHHSEINILNLNKVYILNLTALAAQNNLLDVINAITRGVQKSLH